MLFRRSRSRDAPTLAARRLAALDGAGRGADRRDDDLPGLVEADPGDRTHELLAPGRHADRRAARVGRLEALRLTSQHIAVIAVVAALACILTGWRVLRSVPEPQPVELSNTRVTPREAPTIAAGVSSATPSGDATAPSTAAPLIVDVTGKVRRPGIVELPAGARVVDALQAAGGARPRVDTSDLNLARLLVDGEQIVVGSGGQSPVPAGSDGAVGGTPQPTINVNSATAEQLDGLPGVGPVTAAAIIEWRTQHGAFSSVDELLEVSGIGDATLAEMKPFVQL